MLPVLVTHCAVFHLPCSSHISPPQVLLQRSRHHDILNLFSVSFCTLVVMNVKRNHICLLHVEEAPVLARCALELLEWYNVLDAYAMHLLC